MDISRRDFWMPSNLFAALFLGLILSGGEGVRIKELRVPDILVNGTEEPAILDCDYTLDMPASKSGLVVKWFFNNHPAPVYQWIYNKRPQYLGVLKGKVNLNYRATNEESTMYRGFEITTPTVELSGEYKCLVSTFDKEDSRSKKMVIYVPESSLDVTQEKPVDTSVVIKCSAEGVYPEPNLTILADGKSKLETQISMAKQANSSLFNIRGELAVKDSELESPTTFECELSIPDAKYSNRRKLVYFPGPPTTPSAFEDIEGPLTTTSEASGSTIAPSLLGVTSLLALIASARSTGL